jgi:hypothetical protein
VFGERDVLGARQGALKLYAWLWEQPDARAHETVMLHIGPKALRTRARRDTVLATLEQARLVDREGAVPELGQHGSGRCARGAEGGLAPRRVPRRRVAVPRGGQAGAGGARSGARAQRL